MSDTEYTAHNPFDDDDDESDKGKSDEEAPVRKESLRFDAEPLESEPKNPFDDDVEDLQKTSPALPPKSNIGSPSLPPKTSPIVAPSETEHNFQQALKDREAFLGEMNSSIEMTPEGIARKEAELRMRAENIERREQKLYQKEKSLSDPRKSNWPPCKPFLYHNIREDMPTPEGVWLVRKAYFGWFATWGVMIYNFAVIFAALIILGDISILLGMLAALIYTLVGVPITFLIYRVLYNAVRKSKPSLYLIYIILLTIELLVYLVLAVGFKAYGGGGFFCMLDLFNDDSIAGGVLALLDMVLLVGRTAFGCYLWWVARREYKKCGGLLKAKGEFTDVAKQGLEDNPDLVEKGMKGAAKASKKAKKKMKEDSA